MPPSPAPAPPSGPGAVGPWPDWVSRFAAPKFVEAGWTPADLAAVENRLAREPFVTPQDWRGEALPVARTRPVSAVLTYLDAPGDCDRGWPWHLRADLPLPVAVAAKIGRETWVVLDSMWRQAQRHPGVSAEVFAGWLLADGFADTDLEPGVAQALVWEGQVGPQAWLFRAAGITTLDEARAAAPDRDGLALLAGLRGHHWVDWFRRAFPTPGPGR